MKLRTAAIYVGPNVYAQHPVVRSIVEDPPAFSRATRRAATILERLESCLDGAGAGFVACEEAHGRPKGRSKENGQLEHLLEHIALEIQRLAGSDRSCVRYAGFKGLLSGELAIAYDEPEIAERAAQLAGELLESVIKPARSSKEASGSTPEFDWEEELARFLTSAASILLPVQDRVLLASAKRKGVPAYRVAGRVIQLGQGRHQQRLSATKTTMTSVVSNDLAANKDYSRRLLSDIGLPVPRFERIYRQSEAVEAAGRIGYPVVVKPNHGNMGGGVSIGLRNPDEVVSAYKRARAIGRSILVEEVIEGADYRMLVINGELIAAAQRVPAHVDGDGVRTIRELVEEANRDPRRGSRQRSSWTKLPLDEGALRVLSDAGHGPDSVPGEGETVYLRRNANTSDGGTAVDVTDQVHPDNQEIAVRAARAVGLDIAGVDLLTTDISKSIWRNGGAVCEINSRPGLRKHMWPAIGRPRDVMTPIVESLFPDGGEGRVTTIVVTGQGALVATARMVAHVLEESGRHVGLALRRQVHLAGRRVRTSRITPAEAMQRIALDPDVDVAVLEMQPRDLVRYGLGCEVVDTALIVGDISSEDDLEAARLLSRCTRDAIFYDDQSFLLEERSPSGDARRADWIRADETGKRWSAPRALRKLSAEDAVRSAQMAGCAARHLGVSPRRIRSALERFRLPATRKRKPAAEEKDPSPS